MPLLKFQGGPWDGVEFEAPTAPDALNMRHMNVFSGTNPETGKATIGVDKPTEHNVYLLRMGAGEDWPDVYIYEFKKDGKPWWDHIMQSQQ